MTEPLRPKRTKRTKYPAHTVEHRVVEAALDVAPGMFKSLLKHTMGEHRYVGVGTSRPGVGGNSQTCLCGAYVPKTLKDRWHDCPKCGLSANIAMDTAFGYTQIGAVKQPSEPGQGFVIRGDGKCQAGQPGLDSSASSTEPSKSRKSSGAQRPRRNSAGAQATVRVKTTHLLSGAQAPRLSS